jgi:hypothetical protein
MDIFVYVIKLVNLNCFFATYFLLFHRFIKRKCLIIFFYIIKLSHIWTSSILIITKAFTSILYYNDES